LSHQLNTTKVNKADHVNDPHYLQRPLTNILVCLGNRMKTMTVLMD